MQECRISGTQFDYDGGGLWTIFHFGKEYAEATQKTTQKTTQKLSKMQEDILAYLAINPAASRKELAMHIDNSTEDGIKYNLDRLKKLGLIQREGAAKGGHWKIVNDDN